MTLHVPGAGELPFVVTELQGGNVSYSGVNELCPTEEEITQWIWTSVGCGAEGVIFWCLNPRAVGWEAGEWSLLDFQNKPSERMRSAAAVAEELTANKEIYSAAKPLLAPVYLLYSKESFWIEIAKQGRAGDPVASEGRLTGAVIKSMAGWYQSLLEIGINGHVAEMKEFAWGKPSHAGETIILSHQLAVHSGDWEKLRHFVRAGGRLIADGLTFFFDEHHLTLMQTGFPLEDVMGGSLSEVFTQRDDFTLKTVDEIELPAHLLKGSLRLTTAKALAIENDIVTASVNVYGNGKAIWVPSLIGLGAKRSSNEVLSNWLMAELQTDLERWPVRFESWQADVMLRTMTTPSGYLTILINKSTEARIVPLAWNNDAITSFILFADKAGTVVDRAVHMHAEETIVIEWR